MYPELEIFLYRLGETEYRAVLRVRHPPSNVDLAFDAEPIRIDAAAFSQGLLLSDPTLYGLRLGQALFEHAECRNALHAALASAIAAGAVANPQVEQLPVRIRLCTDQRSLKLQRLRWETLHVPSPDAPSDVAQASWIIADRKWVFSRHLFSGDMRPIRLRPQSDLSALIAIASPTDISRYTGVGGRPLSAINVPDELQVAEHGLQLLAKDRLIPDSGKRVTLARLLEALAGEPDVLYLVCHGALVEGEPRLLLEKDDGTGQVVAGSELVRELGTLRNLPRLVVLLSCRSGGDGTSSAPADQNVLSALGPRLAEAGVPAVLAMQGDLDMETARAFLPPFFAALRTSGQVDEAVTIGRAAARSQGRPDAWVPVLYTRLVEGRLWYRSGLSAGTRFGWQELAMNINKGKCVPILGSGVLDPFVGSTRALANRLAAANGYPVSLTGREDLPQVAQFLETMRGNADSPVQVPVVAEMAEAISRRFPELKLGRVSAFDPGEDLRQRLKAAWQLYKQNRPYEPHAYLARFKTIRTIISTNPDDLLEEALGAVGRTPRVHRCSWEEHADEPPPPAAGDGPDVYHLMGHLSDLDSIILSEDEYFRFLTAFTRRQAEKRNANRDDDQHVDLLRGALARSALLFLGFRIMDWDFRSLCRLLIDQNGKLPKRTHVLVQIDPEDGTHGDAVRARDYIERLFEKLLGRPLESQVAVYWGTAEDFFEELDKQWSQLQATTPAAQPSLSPVAVHP